MGHKPTCWPFGPRPHSTLSLTFYVGDELKDQMVGAGWDLSASQGTDNWTVPIPATLIVGTDGIIHARFG